MRSYIILLAILTASVGLPDYKAAIVCMAKGDTVVLTCPHCGSATPVTITITDGGQSATCQVCRKNFMVDVNGGNIKGVRK